jgi:hypothetical protein
MPFYWDLQHFFNFDIYPIFIKNYRTKFKLDPKECSDFSRIQKILYEISSKNFSPLI